MRQPEFRFGTSGIREKSDFFTDSRVERLGCSIRNYLDSDTNKVVVGYDTREGSKRISEILSSVISENFDVYLAERPTPTPAVSFYCSDNPDVDFGIASTASHNPVGYNGVKLLNSRGRDASVDVTDTISSSIPNDSPDKDRYSNFDSLSIVDYYIDELKDRFSNRNFSDLSVFYDALNGSGYGIVEDILSSMGADVKSNRSNSNVGLDGVEPNPTHVEDEVIMSNMDNSDIGIVTDGDADRVRVYTKSGLINSSELLSIIYEFVISNIDRGDIVRTVGAGSMVDSVANNNGLEAHESKVGFKYICELMNETGAVFGGDQTDGYCYGTHIPNKDGIFTSIIVCIAHSEEPIDQRLSRVRDIYGRRFADRRSIECDDDLKSDIPEFVASRADSIAGRQPSNIVSIDGQKLYFDDSWVLVRPSGTEPKVRLYAESDSRDETSKLLDSTQEIIAEEIQSS